MNANNMTGDLLLEDINTGQRFYLVKTKDKYRCGRSNDCDIISESILASRKHCAFMRVDDDFNVTDLNSSNGTFVNGVKSDPKMLVSLNINDLIGLGCPDVVPCAKLKPGEKGPGGKPPAKATVYRLKYPEPQDIMKYNAKTEPIDSGASSSSDHKRRRSAASIDCKIPLKIPKTEGTNEAEVICISDDSNDGIPEAKADRRKPSDPFKEANLSPIKRDSSWKPPIIGEASTSCANDASASAPLVNGKTEMSFITGASTCFSPKEKRKSEHVDKIHRNTNPRDTKLEEQHSGRMNKKLKSCNDTDSRGEDRSKEKRKSMPARVDSSDFRKEDPKLPSSSAEPSKRKEIPARSETSKDDHREEKNKSFPAHIDSSKSRTEFATSSAQSSKRTEQPVRARNPSKSSRKDSCEEKQNLFSVRNDPPNSRVDNSNPAASSVESTRRDERVWPMRRPSTDSSSGEDIDDLRRAGLLDHRDDDQSSHSSWENVEDFSIPGYNADPEDFEDEATRNNPGAFNDAVIDDHIKWEPELDIIDNDESLYTNDNNFQQPSKPISKQSSNLENEPPTEYSQVDYVDVSDDLEFPQSQLFGDGVVKSESKIKDENEMISRRENDSPDWIELSDSDEEDNPWYNRLMRAELNMSQEISIKQEREEMEYKEHIERPLWEEEDALMLLPQEVAATYPFKEATPNRPLEDAPMFPDEAAKISFHEELLLMSPDEANEMSDHEEPFPMSSPEYPEELAPMPSSKKIPSILPLNENLQEEAEESDTYSDVEADIRYLLRATNENKTELCIPVEDKHKSKKHSPKNLKQTDIPSEKIAKQVSPKDRIIEEDSTSARSKSADSKTHRKKISSHRAMQKSPERATESDDEEPKKSTHKSRSHKEDDKKRMHTDQREADRVHSSNKKRDSTEERSGLRSKSVSDKSTKKRDSTEERSNLKTKTTNIADSVTKKRDSTDESSKHRNKATTIADSGTKKRDSTEETSKHRSKPSSIVDSSTKKRDSTEERSSLRNRPQIIADSIEKKRDSAEEKSHNRTKSSHVADSIDKTSDAADGKSNHRAEMSIRSTTNPVVLLEKLDQSCEKPTRKSVLLVDAPYIGHNQRRGTSVKVIDRSTNNADLHIASTSDEQSKQTAENKFASPKPPKLSTKEKKQLSYEARIKQKMYLKEQKHRRMKNEWADRSLPLRKNVSFSSMTREEKDEIRNDRKERLKQIAEEKKKQREANASPVKRVKAKAKAKVTVKSRFDNLVEDIAPSKGESAKNQPSVVNDKSSEKPKESAKIGESSVINDNSSNKPKETAKIHQSSVVNDKSKETTQSADSSKEPPKNVDLPVKSKPKAKVTNKSRNDIFIHDMLSHANVSRSSVDHRKKIADQEKEKARLSNVRKATTPVREILVPNRVNISTNIKEKERDVLASRLEKESRVHDIQRQICQDWENQTSPINEVPVMNFYNSTAEPESSHPRSTKQSTTNCENIVGDGSTRNLPRVKSSVILDQRREITTFHNGHAETSKTPRGVPTASTTYNSTTNISGDTETVGGPMLNNNFIYQRESPLASRDPRIKAGKPVKLKSLLKKSRPSKGNKNGVIKRVSFDDINVRIQLFEIDPGNVLRKCLFKDAPSTNNRNAVSKRYQAFSDTPSCPKLEKFLQRIFNWNPSWLEEQQNRSTPPPVVVYDKLVKMPPKYESFEEYYDVAEPLLALELWHGITKDYEGEQIIQKSTMICSIVDNSVTRTLIPGTDISVTTMLIEVLVSKRELDARIHPVYGDLIFFEYVTLNPKGGSQFRKSFAYVTKVYHALVTPYTQFNRALERHVPNPHMLLTFTVITKPMNPNGIQTNKISRLGTIKYLRSNIRMIQGLQFLPASPLLHTILDPKVEDYQLPRPGNLEEYQLVTKDNLNTRQREAVSRITQAVAQQVPKICLIQGPPGTGKSKVIVNIITQILHNRESASKKPMGILVCAPSNAAIDEIVLRLLDIRQKLDKGKRFKMVRIGRDQVMHPLVKDVSLKELARKNLKTKTDMWKTMDFSEEDFESNKRLLEAQKNALELELTTSKSLDSQKRKLLTRKLEDCKAQYEVLISKHLVDKLDAKKLMKLQMIGESDLLKGADVIAGTLTSCYSNAMESIFVNGDSTLSVCIVDEATQSIEAETLVPLMLGVKTLVLVGDPNQLPATVISQKAKKFGLDQSLFARIQRSMTGHDRNPIILLDTQYRMSYPIALWPNKYFYGGALKNAAKLPTLPWNFYKVIHLDSTQDINKFTNTNEANFVASLIYTMMARSNLDDAVPTVRVGIITPYNDQKTLVMRKIGERIAMLPESTKRRFAYEVNTIDSFQGQERDVIIMSCVRSNGIGFLSDRQRLCVALTRAKHSLMLCGNFTAFQKDPMWRALLADARERKVYTKMKANADVCEITRQIIR